MKKRIIIFGILIIIALINGAHYAKEAYTCYCTRKVQAEWRENFPRTLDRCEKLPHPDSLYIFLMAGQSNMAGRAFVEPQDTLPNSRILTIDSCMRWIYAKEPLHFYEPVFMGLDCGLSFAKSIIDSVPKGVSVAMIPCAVGSTTVEQWLANETNRGVPLLDNFKTKVKYCQQYGKIKGILWHQGESNAAAESIGTYYTNLDSLFTIFRTSIQDSVPILVGELGRYATTPEKQAYWDSINSIIHAIEHHEHDIFVVNTKALSDRGDGLHFDSNSQRKLGSRFAKRYLNFLKSKQN